MKNIEIKAPLPHPDRMRQVLAELGARDIWTRWQTDTFFRSSRGWLKLRETADGCELIAYQRPTDTSCARVSDYSRVPTLHPQALKEALHRSLGLLGVVRKQRNLWRRQHTRIHLDEVAGLGHHLELETVVDGISEETARAESEDLVISLGLDRSTFIAVPYLQLLDERGCP